MEPKSVVERLKEFGQTRTDDSDWRVLDSETESLIRRNPFAFLIAVAFDRGMPWQKAWRIPAEIDRQGRLDPKLLASMGETELIGLLDGWRCAPGTAQSKAPGRCRTPPDWSGSGSEETPTPSGRMRLPPRWRRPCRKSMGSEPGSRRWRFGYFATISTASEGRSGR